MSKTKTARVPNDFYPTDAALTRYLLKVMGGEIWGTVLEPCAGELDMVKVLYNGGLIVHHSDIKEGDWNDVTKPYFWQNVAAPCRWVVTNPPFNVAPLIIPQAFDHATRGIAMLLRLSYQKPCANRADWLKANAKHLRWEIVFCNPRPRFRSDTSHSDSVTTSWQVWDKDWTGGTTKVYANDWKVKRG